MFDVLIFLGFASLIGRFSRVLAGAEYNVHRTGDYIEQAQRTLQTQKG